MAVVQKIVTASGIINTSPFFETTVAQFRQLFDINVIGSFLSVREGAKYMQSGARVCMVASISSYTGGGYVARGAYATSKGAVLTMMKSCARELGPRGIAVNAVAPGFIDTPFVASAMNDPVRRKEVEAAVGKVGTAEQIADHMEHWFRNGAADGFNLMPDALPGGLQDFVDGVVPILQRRGIFRTDYAGRTLREHFGLARPASQAETRAAA